MSVYSAVQLTVKDYDGEVTTIEVRGPAGTTDGANAASLFGLMGDVRTAVEAVILGEVQSVSYIMRRERVSTSKATAKDAQREVKLLVSGEIADIFKRARIEVGTFDLAQLAAPPAGHVGPSYVDLATGDGQTLKLALDAFWQAGDNYAKGVTVDEAIHVGRNI